MTHKCITEGCDGTQRAKGMCMRCYNRQYRGGPRGRQRGLGDPRADRLQSAEAKFEDAKTSYANACGVAARVFWRAKVAESETVLRYVQADENRPKQSALLCIMCGKVYGGKKPKRALAICSPQCRERYAEMAEAEAQLERV